MTLTVLSVAFPFAPVGPDAAGGAEQVLWLMDKGLSERGDRSVVIASAGAGTRGQLHLLPIPAHPWGEPEKRQVHELWRAEISRLVLQLQPDVLHMHGLDFACYLPEELPRNVRVCITLHLSPESYPPGSLDRAGLELVCVSRSQQAAVSRSLPVHLIPNGIDVESYEPSGTRERWAMALGRICPEKGLHLAIDAARRAGMPLMLAGQVFPYDEHIRYFDEQIVPRLGGDVEFLGPVGLRAKRHLMSRARCLLIPSLVRETSSLVAMEAAASGCPVVAFRQGALPEVVEHGATGFIVDDVETMAAAAWETTRFDPRSLRARALERFGHGVMVDAYRSLFLGDKPCRSSL